MNELEVFANKIREIRNENEEFTIEGAREIVKLMNEFLYTNYEGIGTLEAFDSTFEYFSDFHKYWEENYREILDITIVDDNCALVAEKLHDVYVNTSGSVFNGLYDTGKLKPEEICRLRFLTANQDFNGSRDFVTIMTKYHDDPDMFDVEFIHDNPEKFLSFLGFTHLSQGNKRLSFAENICQFLIERTIEPFDLLSYYDNDLAKLRDDLISTPSNGFANKKTDMFLRDMVVLGVWKNYKGFEKVDVPSDVNTIKVALRTGIMSSKIPLLSSFLDIFGYQYSYVDEMNAKSWRRVWEIWNERYPEEVLESPALIDYFVYRTVGKVFCKSSLYYYKCENNHFLKWRNGMKRKCPECNCELVKIGSTFPCNDDDASVLVSEYLDSFKNCPFKEVCDTVGNKELQPPKSISIMGDTGWITGYARKDIGGGGLMA